jgi:serine protease Do
MRAMRKSQFFRSRLRGCAGPAFTLGHLTRNDTAGERPAAKRGRGMALHIALPVAAAAALATMGVSSAASATPAPSTCDEASVVTRALPSVVNIRVVKIIDDGNADPGKPTAEHIDVAAGSGAIVDSSGVIVTNRHVIQDGAVIQVTFNDRTQLPAQLIAAGALTDLAVLKVNAPQPLPALHFGNSDHLALGEPVIAIGNPLGIGTSVSTGVVSGLDRNLMRTPFDDYIQTDATINPGNSGGPLIDCAGNIIGVNTALMSNNKVLGSIGIGFALPSNDVRFATSALRGQGPAAPNWIGLHLQDLTARLATVFGRPAMTGGIVTGTDPDSPAAHASLQPGDIVAGADGTALPDARAILRFILEQPSDKPISLAVWRGGQMTNVTVTGQPWPHIVARREDVLANAAAVARVSAEGIGAQVTAITAADRTRYGLKDASGVLIGQVTPGTQAAEVGLKPGDVIERVDGGKPSTPEVLASQLHYGEPAGNDLIALLVRSGGTSHWVTLYIGHVDVQALLAAPAEPPDPGIARSASASADATTTVAPGAMTRQ